MLSIAYFLVEYKFSWVVHRGCEHDLVGKDVTVSGGGSGGAFRAMLPPTFAIIFFICYN